MQFFNGMNSRNSLLDTMLSMCVGLIDSLHLIVEKTSKKGQKREFYTVFDIFQCLRASLFIFMI